MNNYARVLCYGQCTSVIIKLNKVSSVKANH